MKNTSDREKVWLAVTALSAVFGVVFWSINGIVAIAFLAVAAIGWNKLHEIDDEKEAEKRKIEDERRKQEAEKRKIEDERRKQEAEERYKEYRRKTIAAEQERLKNLSSGSTGSGRITHITGEDFERYCASVLLEAGFSNISLTPKSGDFGADIIAFDKGGRKICVQCKKYSSSVGIAAVQEVFSAKQYYNCNRAMVMTNAGFTQAAQDLAKKTGVELITVRTLFQSAAHSDDPDKPKEPAKSTARENDAEDEDEMDWDTDPYN